MFKSFLVLKKQLSTVFSSYILYIDLIRNLMHNTHMYIPNAKQFHIYKYILYILLYTPWVYDSTPKAIFIFKSNHVASKNAIDCKSVII